jgi:isopentenyl-diphosphate delta-isomerase
MITATTGGYPNAGRLNKELARMAEKHGIAMGLGSQRAMIEDPKLAESFKIRKEAPSVPIVANIGAVQLKEYRLETIEKLVSSVEADALAIHLNALQEVIQPEGDTDFKGVLDAIGKTCSRLKVPVIVKETGAGMSRKTAEKLKGAGVKWIDVAGAGGTSWSRIEYLRSKNAVPGFEDWGISTVESIMMCNGVLPLIASGGVRSGIDAAKAIALGADIAGAAQPFLKALVEKRLDRELMTWEKQLRVCAFLTGSKNLAALKTADIFV